MKRKTLMFGLNTQTRLCQSSKLAVQSRDNGAYLGMTGRTLYDSLVL